MTMTKQHFELIARVLETWFVPSYQAGYDGYRVDAAKHFANALAATNPNFNRARFLAACGVE